MFRSSLTAMAAFLSLTLAASAQTVPNPKLSASDLVAAHKAASEAGGAELTYATRLDAIEKGKFDTLVVVYAKPREGGPEYYVLVTRGDEKFPLKIDRTGRALEGGDRFLRMGLRHEAGKPPVLRLIAAARAPGQGEVQRNVDYQFSGQGFVFVTQTLSALAK
jgi:hypothetical protein